MTPGRADAPPPRERVERFRWQYGVGPGLPFVAPEATYGAGPSTEPAPGGVEAPKPAARLAWLFSPGRR